MLGHAFFPTKKTNKQTNKQKQTKTEQQRGQEDHRAESIQRSFNPMCQQAIFNNFDEIQDFTNDFLQNDLTLVPEVRLRFLKKGKRSELNFRKIWLGCRHLRPCLGGQKRRGGSETLINPKIGAFLRGSRAPQGHHGHFQRWSLASFISGSMSHGP